MVEAEATGTARRGDAEAPAPAPAAAAAAVGASGGLFSGLDLTAAVRAAAAGARDGGPASAPDSYNVFDVLHVLSSFRQNHERLKLYHVSLSVVRFLSVLNVVYTVLGVTFLLLSLCQEWTPEFNELQRAQFFKLGLTMSVFAPLASFVDLMALRGLQLWRRAYLLPWLFLYAFAVSFIFANSFAGILHHGFRWTYLVLGLVAFCVYSAWRHVRAQYNEMSRERPTCRTVEELADELRQAAAAAAGRDAAERQARIAATDLPPKYEDLDQPPVYSEDLCRETEGEEQDEAAATVVTVEDETRSMLEVDGAAALPPPPKEDDNKKKKDDKE